MRLTFGGKILQLVVTINCNNFFRINNLSNGEEEESHDQSRNCH